MGIKVIMSKQIERIIPITPVRLLFRTDLNPNKSPIIPIPIAINLFSFPFETPIGLKSELLCAFVTSAKIC